MGRKGKSGRSWLKAGLLHPGRVPASSASYPLGGALHPSLGEMGLVKDPSSPFPHPVLGYMGCDVSNSVPELWVVISWLSPTKGRRRGSGVREQKWEGGLWDRRSPDQSGSGVEAGVPRSYQ